MSKATPLLSKEDTNQVHPLQAILLCEPWGEEKRWGPLVRRQTDDDDEEEDEQEQGSSRRVKGENRPWVRSNILPSFNRPSAGLDRVMFTTATSRVQYVKIAHGLNPCFSIPK